MSLVLVADMLHWQSGWIFSD